MSTGGILILGAIAGLTIFLGLPIGRLRNVSLSPARGPLGARDGDPRVPVLGRDVARRRADRVEHRRAPVVDVRGEAALLVAGFTAGLMSLVYYEAWMQRSRSTVDESSWLHGLTPARRLALLIATGIGLHNFGEGLAIGQSAAAGEISLALVLIIGFGLHNATEGFGIVGPMSAEAELPSWRFLIVLGLIGGGPTFLGHAGRAGVGQPGARCRLLRGCRRVDPLRGHAALRRLQALRANDARLVDAAARDVPRFWHGLGSRSRRGLNYPGPPWAPSSTQSLSSSTTSRRCAGSTSRSRSPATWRSSSSARVRGARSSMRRTRPRA